ncbi:hypothetical protein NKH45_35910 [Mesorhizobium sp. M1156]|uniref:hypothetical protein n=1 Tax=Mesorhizobium sp. M1156 TaxID=2957064 RepID=UPI0033351AD5
MEPKLVAKPPEGEHWIHEIKLDGYRTQIIIKSPDDIRAFSSSGADWTRKYAGIIEAARILDVERDLRGRGGRHRREWPARFRRTAESRPQ